MVYKRFTIYLLLRLFLILVMMIGLSCLFIFLDRTQLIFTFIILFILLIWQVINLIRYVNTTNRLLAGFLQNIRHNDFSIHYERGKSKSSISELYQSFNQIVKAFKQIELQKEIQYRFLDKIVELISIGIIAINSKGEIVLMNSASEHLLGVKKPGKWEQLKAKCKEFTLAADSIENSGRTFLESSKMKGNYDLAIQVNNTVLLNDKHRIITFQNIKTEIEQKETEAWIKLIRTLNHEIMNSTTPISSLTETILMIFEKDGKPKDIDELSKVNIEDMIASVKTIQNRSNGLYDFVNEYRKLTKIPQPKKEEIILYPYLEDIGKLMHAEMGKHEIKFKLKLHREDFAIIADPKLLQQVLINLIKNSIEALKNTENARIMIASDLSEESRPTIEICDNGTGIDKDIHDEIFTPFFSTKEEGSGIGLSLSRQIMRLHGGTIVLSDHNEFKTCFRLLF